MPLTYSRVRIERLWVGMGRFGQEWRGAAQTHIDALIVQLAEHTARLARLSTIGKTTQRLDTLARQMCAFSR